MDWQFVCPRDHGELEWNGDNLTCLHCGMDYPIVDGVPVLINDENSVFAVDDFRSHGGYSGASYGRPADRATGLRRLVRRMFHRLAQSPSSIRHLGWREAVAHACARSARPRILVVGSGGLDYRADTHDVLHTDVAFGPYVAVIADAHDLPLPDRTFDLAIAIAVLEHVADPQRCVSEIQRVLRPGGCVYAVTPFLQPVHMGAYDFTRFTPLGHRRLFRWFDVIDAGVSTGVGSVAAWVLSSVLQAVSGAPTWRRCARATALLCAPPLRSLDRWLRAPAHVDAAGSMYLFGRLRTEPVPDRTLIQDYRGAFGRPLAPIAGADARVKVTTQQVDRTALTPPGA